MAHPLPTCWPHVCSYGHLLAWKSVGRGHGSRALLRRARGGTLMQDASYWCCLQLEGDTEALCNVMDAARWVGGDTMGELGLLNGVCQTIFGHVWVMFGSCLGHV